jgi:hypothetical protein
MRASPERLAAGTVRPCRPAAANSFISSSSFGLTIRPGRREAGGSYSLSTLNSHNACGTIRFVGDYQLQAGRPSGSGAKVRHGMRGQRYARLNLDLHAMTPRRARRTSSIASGVYFGMRPIITRPPKRKELHQAPIDAQVPSAVGL